MKSNKSISLATVFFLVMLTLALALPNAAFALQYGDFTYEVSGGTVTITGYSCPGGSAVIPASIDGMPVVGIGDSAFEGFRSLTSVTIPDSVTNIGSYAFWGCSSMTSVTIPNSVTDIGYYAFLGCSTLISVTIPNSVTSIWGGAFAGCSGLINIVVDASNTVYSSQDGVLYNKALTVLIQYPGGKSGGFTIPDSITSIGGYAFDGCTGLTSVTIPNSVTAIKGAAFSRCTGLTKIAIPDSVTSIEDGTFYNCTGLTSVTIPDSVTSIGSHAFASCTSLTSVTIPSSITIIWDWAFYGCAVLTKAYFLGNAPTMGTGVGGVFDGCASNFTVCYRIGNKGFSSPTWYGYPARVCADNQCAAEAIYGRDSEETELLREYRDNVLNKIPEGQELIKTYYKLSPTVKILLERNPLLKNRAKAFIDSMLPGIRKKVEESSSK